LTALSHQDGTRRPAKRRKFRPVAPEANSVPAFESNIPRPNAILTALSRQVHSGEYEIEAVCFGGLLSGGQGRGLSAALRIDRD
jgi:hypothetical protein